MMSKKEMPIVQDVFTVKRKEYITPNYIRVTLTGNVEVFKESTLGDNNKVFVPPNNMNSVHMRYYDYEQEKWILPELDVRPVMRTYTHRAIDLEKNELTIDFVNHGLNGPASSWAIQAQKGAELGVAMKKAKKELYPKRDWYLLVGDATAIPIISVILESLPSNAKGVCLLEVHGKEDEQVLKTKAAIDFVWLHNSAPEEGSGLYEKLKTIELEEGSKFGYVACEFRSVKEIRNYLRKDMSWTVDELYAYSYWKSGVAEDASAEDRRKERN